MKNLIVIIVVSFLVFGVTSICAGVEAGRDPAPTPTPTEKKKTSAKHLKKVSGKVTAIDKGEKSITLEGITIIADEGMLANIKEGDKVTVDYYSRGVHRAVFIVREVK